MRSTFGLVLLKDGLDPDLDHKSKFVSVVFHHYFMGEGYVCSVSLTIK